MMDFAAIDAPSRCGRIQAIALRQEMRQRAAPWLKGFPGTAVSRLKSSTGRPRMSALALILNPAVDFSAPHARTEIRQAKGQSSHGNGRCAVRSNMEDIVRERATLDSLARSIYPSEASKNRILWITNRSKASNRSKERQHATQSKCRLARRPQDGQGLDFHR